MFGAFFVPTVAFAFSFFGSEVSASGNPLELGQSEDNSQTGLALEPSASPISNPTDEINIVSENALLATATPKEDEVVGVGGGYFEDGLEIYVVRPGDTIEIVAEMFGVSVDTILSANDLARGSKLKVDDILLILPFSGVEHTVAKGETLQGIASKYKVDIDDILSANDLEDASLTIGEKLMIPGASMSTPSKSKSGGTKWTGSSSVPLEAGSYTNPVPGARKSRGVKPGHKGVDLAAPTGTPIHAAISGTVLIARMGWNGGFGNYVVEQLPNGCKAIYAHMSKLNTTPGAQVSKGEIIGYVGSTGHSTGPHLHFELVGGCKNPF